MLRGGRGGPCVALTHSLHARMPCAAPATTAFPVQMLEGKPGAPKFTLHVKAGEFSDSQIVVMLGENGTGKTTFIRMLAGLLAPDAERGKPAPELAGFSVSYKPQKISPSFEGSVRALFFSKIRDAVTHPQFGSDVMKPLNVEHLLDNEVKTLSGGELQRVALALCLGKPADVYLIDEPSAYLDSEQRIVAAKIIKRFILHAKKTAFIVEHDFIMATYLADRVIVYEGTPGVEATATAPTSLLSGMNRFLKVRPSWARAGNPAARYARTPATRIHTTVNLCSNWRSHSDATRPTSVRASTSAFRLRMWSRKRRARTSTTTQMREPVLLWQHGL